MAIVITSKRDGFRRCGIAHPSKPTSYPDEFFTEEQLQALDKEPQLILDYAEGEFDQVKDALNETLSQTLPPQAPVALPVAQSQAPETVIAPVVAPVVIATVSDPVTDQAGPAALGPVVDGAKGDIDPLKGQQSPQDDETPPATQDQTPVDKPDKTRVSKTKDAAK